MSQQQQLGKANVAKLFPTVSESSLAAPFSSSKRSKLSTSRKLHVDDNEMLGTSAVWDAACCSNFMFHCCTDIDSK